MQIFLTYAKSFAIVVVLQLTQGETQMMITLSRKEVDTAIREYLGSRIASSGVAMKMTWYVDDDNRPWKLEVEEVKEEGNE